MSGQWRGSDRKSRLPADWPQRRRRILERDGYRCQELTAYGPCTQIATDVDHVAPGDDDRDENLQSLCADHHAKKSAREGAEAKRRKYTQRRRPPEPHPGSFV